MILTRILALFSNAGINADEEGGQPSDQFLEEVREYFQQHPISDSSLSREARQARGGKGFLI